MSSTKSTKVPVIILCALAAAAFILRSVTLQVNESEVVIISRFGKAVDTKEPGLAFKLPYPIEEAHRLDRRLQHFERPPSQTALKEINQTVIISLFADWKISDPIKFLRGVKTINNANDNILDTLTGTAVANIMSRYELKDLFNNDPNKNKLDEAQKAILEASRLNANEYGIEIAYLGFSQVNFPPGKVTEAVLERMSSERQKTAETYRQEGLKKAAGIRSQASAEARQIRDNALIEGEKIRAEGEATIASSYKVFSQNIELADFLLRLETARNTLTDKKTTLILGSGTMPFDIFKDDFLKKSLEKIPTPKKITGEQD